MQTINQFAIVVVSE